MLVQKSKHAKRRMIMQLLKSNYVKRETDAMLKKDKYGQLPILPFGKDSVF
jgi:hypothetical protein